MERFGRVRYGSKKFDKYKSHEVTSKWLEWTNSGTVYPVEIVKRGMQRDSGRFLRINNSHDYNNFNDNEEDKCQSATKVSQSYSSSENLRPLSYRSSKSSSFSSRVSSVITGSSHDSDSQNEVLPEVTKSKFAFHSNSNRNSVDNNSSNSALSGHSCHAELTSQLSIKDQVVNETRPVIVLWSMEEEQNDGKSVNNDNYEEGIIKADSITTDNRNTRTSDINTKHETHDNNSNTNLQESNNSCVTVEKVSRNIFYMNITDDKDCDTVGNISYSNSCSYNYSSITEGNSSNSKPPLDPMKRLRQGDSFSTFSHINSIDRFSESEYSDNVSRNNSNSSFQHSNSIDTNISVQTISSNNCTNYPVIIPPVILQRDLSRKLSRRESSEEFDRSPNMCNFMFKG